ncbi:alpha/beta fold hydrolase [Rhabdobacter roseus]|uniref:Dipeptidyl aminopeptidase/acylaminoacyl peptidase n=1 Tax=Rhabdobacter roseus TaxID=1655419 RepID=A0A840TXD2_9BACT|nr:prolyl oligopeptidase family serine peptidase [Rhabdobacter roseus]MBB5284590.1 dipeptidyl aminopeptidase/acylaminoacyl peptidase [Rhabdobacter roseus]
MKKTILLLWALAAGTLSLAQERSARTPSLEEQVAALQRELEGMRHTFDNLDKAVDDVRWHQRLGDVAYVDKVIITGPPPAVVRNPTGQGAKNPVRFSSYVFIPSNLDPKKKYPLLVLPHGGVHSNFNTAYAHIIRELIAQEYVVVAPEYRGSTGYGGGFYRLIDYGGLEVEDTKASRDYMLKNYDFVDKDRVGILGWSHGGMITLLNLFDHPDDYKVGYAGVPVSDLVARMGYKTQGYRDMYSADYHMGKSAYENVNEYRRRSPAWNTHKLKTPLLVHTNTIDEDVNVLEVEHLIKALKADGKKFEYEIYKDVPGGHTFDRIDNFGAKEIRLKVYTFLAQYLKPNKSFKNVNELNAAGYFPR